MSRITPGANRCAYNVGTPDDPEPCGEKGCRDHLPPLPDIPEGYGFEPRRRSSAERAGVLPAGAWEVWLNQFNGVNFVTEDGRSDDPWDNGGETSWEARRDERVGR